MGHPSICGRCLSGSVATACFWLVLLCVWLPLPVRADGPFQPASDAQPQTVEQSLMGHPGWQRLDALVSELPFAWAKRYVELRTIAEDADGYSVQLPLLLAHLRGVTAAAQGEVIALLLDMVPAQTNVQELSFLLGMLDTWRWKLEPPLRRTASAAAGIDQALDMLTGIGQAVDELQANTKKRPIMEKTAPDFVALFTLVHQRVQQLHIELNGVRSTALGLYNQIETTYTLEQALLPEKWIAYYTTPLMVSSMAFTRLRMDFVTLMRNLTYDEGFPLNVPFAAVFNLVVLAGLGLLYAVLRRVAQGAARAGAQLTFAQHLCRVFQALDLRRRLAFGVCVLIMLNTLVDALPQLHAGIPFVYLLQLFMVIAVAVWMRTTPADPHVWELATPAIAGLMLLHGDGSSLLTLCSMSGILLLVLCSLLRRRGARLSGLRLVWGGVLLGSLLLTVLGFGRLTVPLYMIVMIVRAAAVMLLIVNDSPILRPYTLARAWFVPLFTLFLGLMSVSFLLSCSGFVMLRNYWYTNAVPILGLRVTYGDAVLTLFFLLGIIFVANLFRQVPTNLGHNSRVVDASAVPVLRVMVNCGLATIFGFFVMSCFGMDVTSLAFIGGGVSIGIGFAAKTVLSNFFCGLVIIFSRVVRAGDIVDINDVSGRVLSVNMRATVVETLSNGILLVPNEALLSGCLTNWSLNNLHVREDIEISVPSYSEMDAVLAVLEDAPVHVAGVLADPPPVALLTGIEEDYLVFTLKVWVKDVRIRATTLGAVRKAVYHMLESKCLL